MGKKRIIVRDTYHVDPNTLAKTFDAPNEDESSIHKRRNFFLNPFGSATEKDGERTTSIPVDSALHHNHANIQPSLSTQEVVGNNLSSLLENDRSHASQTFEFQRVHQLDNTHTLNPTTEESPPQRRRGREMPSFQQLINSNVPTNIYEAPNDRQGPMLSSSFTYQPTPAQSSTNVAHVTESTPQRCKRRGRPPLPKGMDLLLDIPSEPYELPISPECLHCKAKRFHLEPVSFCCSEGEVSLASNETPLALWELLTSSSDEAKEFQTYVRTYNNSFAFTSFGVKYDKDLCRRNKGIYTFRAQGQVYHYLNELLPTNGLPSYLQLYFFDTEHEIQNRIRFSDRQSPHLLSALLEILKDNPYCQFFRSLSDVPNVEECTIILKSNASLDQRVFNAPSVSQVAAIWVEDDGDCLNSSRDILVYSKPGYAHRVQYYFGCYDPLQYPLLFPAGDLGWHEGIEKTICKRHGRRVTRPELDMHEMHSAEDMLLHEERVMREGRETKNSVSCREYYAYKLQIRPTSKSLILHGGRLFQQYAVDMYIKLETSRLDFYRLNQKLIRAELYQGIIDSIAIGETHGSQIGKRIVLPASFIGGPRDMRRRYVDAMSLVQYYGKPDLFITMTCNPSWPEITSELLPGEEAQNRPDLIARVFRSKLEMLKMDLFKKHIFGHVAAYVYVIEFQKRGLPHAHFLLIMQDGYKIRSSDMFDRYVCAEIPDQASNPHLYRAVWRHMMHGPCGSLNPENVCMKKNGECKNHYPKQFCERTTQTSDSYPIYRRRDNNRTIKVRNHFLNNTWVIPYNPYLLAKYDCHINVEICSTIKAVKYLYKYIYKGHDRVAFHVGSNNISEGIDEIEMFQSARWVSAPEAVWRIYRFPLNHIFPAVINLQLHLEDRQSVSFSASSNLHNVVASTNSMKTMLTEFFKQNETNPKAREYLYREFPERFIWDKDNRKWRHRQRGFSIGRLVTVSPIEGERYYLRLLLNHVKGPTSFDDLKLVNGVQTASFREAALLHGILEADNSLQLSMQEACAYQMPHPLRRLFATILVYCNPINARSLWEEFDDAMCEDFLRLPGMTIHTSKMKALRDIGYQLESMGKNINEYRLIDDEVNFEDFERGYKELNEETNITVSCEDINAATTLNSGQKKAYDLILDRILQNKSGAFFVDGPGGTGKTYLYRALLATLRCKGLVALATASSGVAASILPGGRTAHSRFKIPVNVDDDIGCNVSKQSGLGKLLVVARLIIWDEAPMVKRQAIEAFNRMMQDICDSNHMFGGKVVVFGGDFRQVLPIVPKGNSQQSIDASLVKSPLWNSLEKIRLTENMRAQQDPLFCDFLLRIGDGEEIPVFEDQIKIPSSMVLPYKDDKSSMEALMDITFPDLDKYSDSLDL